eukprot:gene883-1380_t
MLKNAGASDAGVSQVLPATVADMRFRERKFGPEAMSRLYVNRDMHVEASDFFVADELLALGNNEKVQMSALRKQYRKKFADDEELRAAKKGKKAALVEEGFWDDEEDETDCDMEDVADMEAEEVADTDDEEGVTTPQAIVRFDASEDNLTTYERERMANIARREAYMKELGLDKASVQLLQRTKLPPRVTRLSPVVSDPAPEPAGCTPRTRSLLAKSAANRTKLKASVNRLSGLLQPVQLDGGAAEAGAEDGTPDAEGTGLLAAFASPARRGRKKTSRPATIPEPAIVKHHTKRVQVKAPPARKGPAMGPLTTKNRRLPNGKPVPATAKLVNDGINACFHRYHGEVVPVGGLPGEKMLRIVIGETVLDWIPEEPDEENERAGCLNNGTGQLQKSLEVEEDREGIASLLSEAVKAFKAGLAAGELCHAEAVQHHQRGPDKLTGEMYVRASMENTQSEGSLHDNIATSPGLNKRPRAEQQAEVVDELPMGFWDTPVLDQTPSPMGSGLNSVQSEGQAPQQQAMAAGSQVRVSPATDPKAGGPEIDQDLQRRLAELKVKLEIKKLEAELEGGTGQGELAGGVWPPPAVAGAGGNLQHGAHPTYTMFTSAGGFPGGFAGGLEGGMAGGQAGFVLPLTQGQQPMPPSQVLPSMMGFPQYQGGGFLPPVPPVPQQQEPVVTLSLQHAQYLQRTLAGYMPPRPSERSMTIEEYMQQCRNNGRQ